VQRLGLLLEHRDGRLEGPHARSERAARSDDARVLAILAQPGARSIATKGGSGILAVAPSGKSALVANDLRAAPSGKTYEAWVVTGKAARPAGLFRGGSGDKVVVLTRPVARGAVVAVTLEHAGGSARPTGAMLLRART
jgi:hypothetical protein